MKVTIACCVLVTLSVLTACSPYLYKDELTHVTSAVSSIDSAWKDGQQALVDDYQAIVVERASWNGLPVTVSGPCVVELDLLKRTDKLISAFEEEIKNNRFNRGEQSCKIDLIHDDLNQPDPIADEETIKKIDEILKALSDYSAALLAVTNATDKDALAKGEASFNTAVGQAADIAKKLGAADNNVAIAKAASSVVTDLIGLFLDAARYQVLKHCVIAIDPIMPTLSGEVVDVIDLIHQKRLPILAQRVMLEAVEYNASSINRSSTVNTALLATLLAQTANYNTLYSIKIEDMAKKLSQTHHELADALRQDKGQQAALFDAAKTLADDADKLNKAISSTTSTGKSGK